VLGEEMCALRWHHISLDHSLVTIRRAIDVDENGDLHEKDTKTHQQRRVVLDPRPSRSFESTGPGQKTAQRPLQRPSIPTATSFRAVRTA
jgi:integrase